MTTKQIVQFTTALALVLGGIWFVLYVIVPAVARMAPTPGLAVADGISLAMARDALAELEQTGGVIGRDCANDRATMRRAFWESPTMTERRRRTTVLVFSRLCYEQTGREQMTLVDERGAVLASRSKGDR